jgi:hypothetical protein
VIPGAGAGGRPPCSLQLAIKHGLDSGVVGVPGIGHDSEIKQRGEAGRRHKGVGDGNIGACLRRETSATGCTVR